MNDASALDQTDRCSTDSTCRACGGGVGQLAPATFETPMSGVGCMTLCAACAYSHDLPRMSVFEAARRTAEHCGHVGVDLDEMAALVDAERSPAGSW